MQGFEESYDSALTLLDKAFNEYLASFAGVLCKEIDDKSFNYAKFLRESSNSVCKNMTSAIENFINNGRSALNEIFPLFFKRNYPQYTKVCRSIYNIDSIARIYNNLCGDVFEEYNKFTIDRCNYQFF